jgi:hypothetical protein
MKYFLDTEFIEKTKQPFFGKPYHFLQLISIGLVCEDGREYYAINKDFEKKEASDWVRSNVINNLEYPLSDIDYSKKHLWKTIPEIRRELLTFFGYRYESNLSGNKSNIISPAGLKLYGYYCDYDWVVFCSIFGSMIDLPQGMPMYCRDLKQILDAKRLTKQWKEKHCPDPVGEHNALVDAKWNMSLYNKIFNR